MSVIDTGPGIPADRLEDVFVDGFSTKEPRGAMRRGVGLALVHRLVTRAGGTITASSARRWQVRRHAAGASPRGSRMIRVLVVDDDYHVAHAHALSVARVAGFAVVGEAHTGAEALGLVASQPPDLLLLDMYLPDFSGLELVRQLAASGGRVPDFLLVTAARDIDSVRTAMQLGAFYYLVKPFSFAALASSWRPTGRGSERTRPGAARPTSRSSTPSTACAGTPPRRAAATRTLQPTMARVLEIVTSAPAPVGAAEVAEILGASRPTAQRYLAALVKKQLLDLDLDLRRDRTARAPLPPPPRLSRGPRPGPRAEVGDGARGRGGGDVSERGDAGDVAADDQRLDGVGALVGVHDLHVGHVPGDVVLQQQAVAAEDVPGLRADPAGLAARCASWPATPSARSAGPAPAAAPSGSTSAAWR